MEEEKCSKTCRDCCLEKDVASFRHNRRVCKDCERRRGREYRRSAVGKAKSKKWNEENAERMTELRANWYQNPKNKQKRNKQFMERYHSDPVFKLHRSCARRIFNVIHKKRSTDEYVGCSSEKLQDWFEFCFQDGMTFENHGTVWHIDHVIPVNKFDLDDEEQQFLCFNWRNMMPYPKKDNLSKHDNIVVEQIKIHLTNLKNFHEENDEKIPEKYSKLYAKYLTMSGNPLEL
jgi:hypothetical protein